MIDDQSIKSPEKVEQQFEYINESIYDEDVTRNDDYMMTILKRDGLLNRGI